MKRLTCKEATRLISERQDRPLGFREGWSLRLHLWICVYCRRFERQLSTLRLALRQLRRNTEQDVEGLDLPQEARERIRRALAQRTKKD